MAAFCFILACQVVLLAIGWYLSVAVSAGTLHLLSRGGEVTVGFGTNVTLHCMVSGTSWDPFYNQIIWFKETSGIDKQINTGAVIGSPFDVTQRYAINRQTFNVTSTGLGQVSLSLTIINVSMEDNGTYRCLFYHQQTVSDSACYDIIVVAPVSELRLITNNSVVTSANISDSVVQFTDVISNSRRSSMASSLLAVAYVACEASGGNPAPRLRICLGRTDVTSQFESVVVTTRDGIRLTRLETRLWPIDVEEQHGLVLKCIARIQSGHGRPDIKSTVTATIDIRFSPRITCWPPSVSVHRLQPTWTTSEPVQGHGDEVKVELKCSLKANPPVSDDTVVWYAVNRHSNVTTSICTDSVVGIFNALGITATDAVSPLSRDAVLLIPLVNYTSRDYLYYLRAGNDVGISSEYIDISALTTTVTSTITPSTTSQRLSTAETILNTPRRRLTSQTSTTRRRPEKSHNTHTAVAWPSSSVITSTYPTVTVDKSTDVMSLRRRPMKDSPAASRWTAISSGVAAAADGVSVSSSGDKMAAGSRLQSRQSGGIRSATMNPGGSSLTRAAIGSSASFVSAHVVDLLSLFLATVFFCLCFVRTC